MINDTQCSVSFHVDNNTLSHASPTIVIEIMNKIEEHFGKLSVTRGDAHDFLGINIKIRTDGLITIEQHKHIEELERFGKTYSHKVTSPFARHLCKVNERAEKLVEEQADLFHSIVAKLLHVTKRLRPDIEPTIAFLMTRVSKSDVDDWKKIQKTDDLAETNKT